MLSHVLKDQNKLVNSLENEASKRTSRSCTNHKEEVTYDSLHKYINLRSHFSIRNHPRNISLGCRCLKSPCKGWKRGFNHMSQWIRGRIRRRVMETSFFHDYFSSLGEHGICNPTTVHNHKIKKTGSRMWLSRMEL